MYKHETSAESKWLGCYTTKPVAVQTSIPKILGQKGKMFSSCFFISVTVKAGM